jgi:hypothetical protein
MGGGKLGEHAHGLGALTGEYEGERSSDHAVAWLKVKTRMVPSNGWMREGMECT